ncbi:kinetochore Sim4 complex subunit Fta4 [Dichotomopilus funicola]|uniref:Kinetochore Sim4 complex subunit Fta4 n=1 Tax=Dichotomopilus funicola TaxID=1934379 RepID=A0AAN6ZMR1_9PEZI|nr:kinetochore Sim4 complex subunit Fta4 [Dichotomopilus funicola]
MATSPPTVLALKQSFLTTQTRVLSQPLAPTRDWLSNNKNNNTDDNTDDNNNDSEKTAPPLPEKAIDDALFKLNHRLQQHVKRAYAPQATRHVAEQIDRLYWDAAERAVGGGSGGEGWGEDEVEGGWLNVGADLANPQIALTLPLEWEDHTTTTTTTTDPSPETKHYAALATDLHALADRKTQATARVARLRSLRTLLEPFSSSASSNPNPDSNPDVTTSEGGQDEGNGLGSVQENLVTRNGEVEAELQRMRMLLARVGGRVGLLQEQNADQSRDERGEKVGDVEGEERRKVRALLDGL